MPSLLSTNVHFYVCSNLHKKRFGHHQIVGTECFRPRKSGRRHVRGCVKASWGLGDNDLRTLMRIIRLQSAYRNKSIKEFVELLGDECKYFYTSLPAIHLSQLSKKVLEFLLLMMVRSDVMFVIKPSANRGVDVGVRLLAAWSENNLPIGFGLNVSTSHFYEGMVLIKEANTVLEPLLRLKELPSKLEEILLSLINKVVPEEMLEEKRKVIIMYCSLGLILMAISLLLLKRAFA